jgi:hypothetical protein
LIRPAKPGGFFALNIRDNLEFIIAFLALSLYNLINLIKMQRSVIYVSLYSHARIPRPDARGYFLRF